MRLFTGRLGNTSLTEVQFTAMHSWLEETTNRFSAALKPGETSLGHDAAKAVLAQHLQAECHTLGINPTHCQIEDPAFIAFLQTADPDANGTLDVPEFVNSCVALRAILSVWAAFDTDKDGVITMKFSQLLFAMAHVW